MEAKTATKKVGKPRKKLTIRQKGFVKDYIETKNGTVAAKRNYNVKSDKVAQVIASENLSKPIVQNALADAFPDYLLAKKHKQLMEASTLQRVFFDPSMSDDEIKEVIAELPGHTVLSIERFAQNKKKNYKADTLVLVKTPENFTQGTALRDAYKLKGSYPSGDPEKPNTPGQVTINVLNYTVNQVKE